MIGKEECPNWKFQSLTSERWLTQDDLGTKKLLEPTL